MQTLHGNAVSEGFAGAGVFSGSGGTVGVGEVRRGDSEMFPPICPPPDLSDRTSVYSVEEQALGLFCFPSEDLKANRNKNRPKPRE